MRNRNFKLLQRFKALMTKSAVVQMEIEEETRKKHPDWMRVIMLKKQRLRIKDALHAMRQKRRKRTQMGDAISV